ncbi:MAG: hypothetical protein MJK12_09325 [Colwellia sp.]|nr:hypothetical protein [Colwellia sp.]
MLKRVILILVFLFISHEGKALEIDNIEFDVNKLNEHVYILAQPYGETLINFGVVVGKDGVVLISSMMLDHAPTIEKLIKNLTGSKVKYVINIDPDNYHHHANKYFASKGAIIVGQNNIKNKNKFVDISYEDKVTIDVGTEVIDVVHTSARNPGDSAIYLKNSNIVFLGDSYRNDWIAFSNTSGYKTHLEALKLILSLGNKTTKYVPGNRKSVVYSNVHGVDKAMKLHLNFAETVKELSIKGLSVDAITKNGKILEIVKNLERYNEFKGYLNEHVQDVINSI